MPIQLPCPSCQRLVYFPSTDQSEEDVLEGMCPGCRYKYALVSAKVLSFASRTETLRVTKHQKHPAYHRISELRLSTISGEVKALRLETPGSEERFSGLPGDEILLLYTLRSNTLEDLVWIKNQITAQSYLLHKPGDNARSLGFTTGISVLVSSVVLAALTNFPVKLFLPVAVPAAVGAGVAITRLKNSKLKDKQEVARLASEQDLLGQIHSLEQRLEELKRELATNQKTIKRLQSLKQKMLYAAENLYAGRVETITKGITVLEKQLGLTQSLLEGYTQIVSILNIELETSRLAEVLPEDVSGQILRRMEELKAIEAKHEELSLLVDPARLMRES